MENAKHKVAWVGMGRMGYPMAERLAKAGVDLSVWNRTKSKAEPLGAHGARIVDTLPELASADIVFTMVSTGKDLEQVYFGANGIASGANGSFPGIFVDCSSIGVDQSADLRARLAERGAKLIAAPVSGNGKCVKAGKLSSVASGPKDVYEIVEPYLQTIAGNGVSYVGEGELARFCKIAHNVLLGVVTQNLIEITLMAEKAGVPRHAFLSFINDSVMGSIFTRYKTPALVNLDWTTTFTPALLRKDLDLGLQAARELGVSVPVTAATREALQMHFGAAQLQPDPAAYLEKDFSALMETMALAAGMKLESENRQVASGLEIPG
ncbi:NAD(P)-dependent oxidoreductase [Polymorphum gilvum]|uniref:Putative 3-hydroxyisobutyrate dehydrogenase n=1 Tax=Polymorphum gilvum (strain LMG 25793 / CGMCC 1.9160 / SL003B-26A1) TaxID=991905 RepID=F2IYM7_POLGS|nr:NAD(P)-dependent oxidoreductase [Polymorphum gilvum]ADZ69474.1 Putative 3-hydroxyisobutyrate dehydrogenase [Polymorphum gilvum SL003B-26A1]